MTTNNNNQAETNTPTFTKYQKVWVKAEIAEQSSIDAEVWCVNTKDENEEDFPFYTSISEIRTTAQILQEHGALAPQNTQDRTRPFRERDKVEIVERDGRIPWLNDGFEIGGYYKVSGEEKNGDVTLFDESRCEFFTIPWIFLDLVEPAPEPKYWLHVSPKTYSIYYKGQFGRVITAMLMQKDLYTLEEAQEQCDKLNQK